MLPMLRRKILYQAFEESTNVSKKKKVLLDGIIDFKVLGYNGYEN